MKTQAMIRVSGMILLAVAVSLAVLALIHTLQHHDSMQMFTTVSWNG